MCKNVQEYIQECIKSISIYTVSLSGFSSSSSQDQLDLSSFSWLLYWESGCLLNQKFASLGEQVST